MSLLSSMTRMFAHSFDPAAQSPCGAEASLTAAEIENAALLEVLQAPGARLMSGAILESLLTTSNSKFLFTQPLGQAREVKVALSGLLGRFVARAYLTRYFGYSFFHHLSSAAMVLDAVSNAVVRRTADGDLPDWVTWKPGNDDIAVAEAKGSHDRPGPSAALERAWEQAGRVDLEVNGASATLKRFAIATRWGVEGTNLKEPIMFVRDPAEEGNVSPAGMSALVLGIVRAHLASLLRPLGHGAIADVLDELRTCPMSIDQLKVHALEAVEEATREVLTEGETDLTLGDGLIGGVVTRSGPLRGELFSGDHEILERLNLGPTFVGVEPDVIIAAIKGQRDDLNTAIAAYRIKVSERSRSGNSGAWVQPLRDGYSIRRWARPART
jgi:hypothetical protein